MHAMNKVSLIFKMVNIVHFCCSFNFIKNNSHSCLSTAFLCFCLNVCFAVFLSCCIYRHRRGFITIQPVLKACLLVPVKLSFQYSCWCFTKAFFKYQGNLIQNSSRTSQHLFQNSSSQSSQSDYAHCSLLYQYLTRTLNVTQTVLDN